jgi:hypothetical protein
VSALAILGGHSPVASHTCLHLLYFESLTHLKVGAGAHVARLLAVGRTTIAFGDVHRARRVLIIGRADLTMLHRVRRLVPGGIIVRLMVYTHGNGRLRRYIHVVVPRAVEVNGILQKQRLELCRDHRVVVAKSLARGSLAGTARLVEESWCRAQRIYDGR